MPINALNLGWAVIGIKDTFSFTFRPWTRSSPVGFNAIKLRGRKNSSSLPRGSTDRPTEIHLLRCRFTIQTSHWKKNIKDVIFPLDPLYLSSRLQKRGKYRRERKFVSFHFFSFMYFLPRRFWRDHIANVSLPSSTGEVWLAFAPIHKLLLLTSFVWKWILSNKKVAQSSAGKETQIFSSISTCLYIGQVEKFSPCRLESLIIDLIRREKSSHARIFRTFPGLPFPKNLLRAVELVRSQQHHHHQRRCNGHFSNCPIVLIEIITLGERKEKSLYLSERNEKFNGKF